MRIHGASTRQILKLEALEAMAVAVGGILLGIILTFITTKLIVPDSISMSSFTLPWTVISCAYWRFYSLAAILYPAWKQTRYSQASAVKPVGKRTKPIWQSFYLDILILIISAIEFWRTASTGYQVVLAPEGVATISVNYEAFIGPFCLWIGGVLLGLRLMESGLDRGQNILARAISPIAKRLSGLVAASMSRERAFLTRGIILVALAVSFAVSTSIFNTTYNAQARVDAQLTNGSDVTVTGLAPFEPGDKRNRPCCGCTPATATSW